MPIIKKIHHVAMVVDDMDKALSFWNGALGLTMTQMYTVPAEKSQVAFLPVGESEIELVKPVDDDSGIAKFLARRGPGMHHVCIEVDDLQAMLVHLKAKGIRLIHETPLPTSGGKVYAFVHPESTSGVLVELYQLVNFPE